MVACNGVPSLTDGTLWSSLRKINTMLNMCMTLLRGKKPGEFPVELAIWSQSKSCKEHVVCPVKKALLGFVGRSCLKL